MANVLFGVDRLVSEAEKYRGMRFGVVTNDAARLAADSSVQGRVAMVRAGLNVVRLFSGEHGIAAAAPDGEAVGDGVDPYTKLPVVSLYGKTYRPPRESLEDIDVMLVDLPDVGARFYTYIWTLSHVLEACAEAGKEVWVLDRPNPIGGDLSAVEGPLLEEEKFSTFVGRWRMPVRHSLTIGELAGVWKEQKALAVKLKVVKCEGWRRGMHWPDTGATFVPTSPAMVSYLTAVVYPGTCLFEGTNLSEGRGTVAPFRTFGAPWMDHQSVVDAINMMQLAGIGARPIEFRPSAGKWEGVVCKGVRLEVTDAKAVRPVAMGIRIIGEIARTHADFAYHNYLAPSAVVGSHFDRLLGTSAVREGMGEADAEHVAEWTSMRGWGERAAGSLLYE